MVFIVFVIGYSDLPINDTEGCFMKKLLTLTLLLSAAAHADNMPDSFTVLFCLLCKIYGHLTGLGRVPPNDPTSPPAKLTTATQVG